MNKEEKAIEKLCKYRVSGLEGLNFKELEMSREEITTRRNFIRKILKGTRFNILTNDQLDGSRLFIEKKEGVDVGVFFEDHKGCEFYIPFEAITKSQSDFTKARAMIPFEYLSKRAKDFEWDIYEKDTTAQKNLVSNFITNFKEFRKAGMGLYINSKTKGSGKTFLACCILNELAHRYKVSTKFVTVLDFVDMTKKGYDGHRDEVDSLYKASVLVLDDIGVQLNREWVNSILYQLVNSRYNNKLITIYTSNVEITKLEVDERIIDRIDSTAYNVQIPEKPIRHMKKKEEKDMLLKKLLTV